jgi:hypothetical protein
MLAVPGTFELRDLIGPGSVAAVIAAVEFVKLVVPDLPDRAKPLVALAASMALQLALAWLYGEQPLEAVLYGILVAFTAMGVYSGTKAAVERNTQQQ